MATLARIAFLHLMAAQAQCCKVAEDLQLASTAPEAVCEINTALDALDRAMVLLRRREVSGGKRT